MSRRSSRQRVFQIGFAACAAFTLLPSARTAAQESAPPQRVPATIDHYVRVISTAPSMEGEPAQIYVRERVLPTATLLRSRSLEGQVVLFVHGAGTPAEVAFDAPGASWMGYLADAGYDVFAMDMTGYGRSTRPYPMNDPCSLSEEQQADLVPWVLTEPCAPTYGFAATTIESDWHDLDAVVEYVRALRNVERVHLAAWSLGGPRAGGYAARHPEKVASLILLSPAYSRARGAQPPAQVPAPGPAMTKQSRADFDALWDRQLGCPNQYEPATREAVWQAMLESDPVGATWGTGVRRAPRVTTWGWSAADVAEQRTPMLLIAPETDGQVPPARVIELYEDAGSESRVLAHLECSSHNAMWETNRERLFEASLEWLRSGTVEGVAGGEVRLTRN
ncbi:MAG TPA: alpha/beta fold hydrolase [Longimicrobiales bacterium]|nr:alpha/beta fold hydrolase [Longimicrobiales bacterium]